MISQNPTRTKTVYVYLFAVVQGGLKRETLSRFKGASSETAARSIALPRSRGFSSATTADVYSVAKPEWSRSASFTARDKDVWNIWVQSFSDRWRVLPLWRVGGWGKFTQEREGK